MNIYIYSIKEYQRLLLSVHSKKYPKLESFLEDEGKSTKSKHIKILINIYTIL